jgi:hypothetical protein
MEHYGNASMSASAPTRATHVGESMEQLSLAVDGLHAEIANLEDRLRPILRTEPQKLQADVGAKSGKVPLAATLDERIMRIRGAIERIVNMNACIEL